MREFKIMLVTPLSNVGGTELSTLSLATGLKQAGHHVCVMCNAHPLLNEFTDRGVQVVLAGMQRNPLGLLNDSSRLRRCIDENGIEIVHFQSALPIVMSLLSWRAIKANGVKLVWTCRGIKGASYAVAGHLFNYLIDFVIANCDSEKNRLLRHGLSPQKIKTIYNCLNVSVPEDINKNREMLSELGVNGNTPIVGTASRLAPERGVKYFVEAAAIVSKQVPDVKFVIVGSGPLEKQLRKQVADLNVERQVAFLGPRRDMEKVYSVVDVFVNPGPDEHGTGNTNAEAMAFGKPVVAVRGGGTPEIVQDRVSGLLVPPRDGEELAHVIMLLLKDRELARRMGMAGRERVMRDFTIERLVREVEDVYAELLAL